MRHVGVVLVVLALIVAAWWRFQESGYDWQLPADIPFPNIPADNPVTAAKVELGRWLFYDTRLSGNRSMACASCHIQALAFTDGKSRSVGSTGELHPRSSMSLVNVAYAGRLTWSNPLLDRLEDQALTPLLGDNPVEMGLGPAPAKFSELLRTEVKYRKLSQAAFPSDPDPYSILNGIRAISAFVRTIIAFDSAYDRYMGGDDAAPGVEKMDIDWKGSRYQFKEHGFPIEIKSQI